MCCKTDSCFIDGAQFGGLVDRPLGRLMPWDFIMGYFSNAGGKKLTPEDLQERIDRTFNVPVDCPVCRPIRGRSRGRYEPVKNKQIHISTKAKNRYYKLDDGNIIDIETKTILLKQGLLELMQ